MSNIPLSHPTSVLPDSSVIFRRPVLLPVQKFQICASIFKRTCKKKDCCANVYDAERSWEEINLLIQVTLNVSLNRLTQQAGKNTFYRLRRRRHPLLK